MDLPDIAGHLVTFLQAEGGYAPASAGDGATGDGYETAVGGLGDEEAKYLVRKGQAAGQSAVVEVDVDGWEVAAQEVLAGQLLEERAECGREFLFLDEFLPLVAVLAGGGAELVDGVFGGVLAHEGVYFAA